MVSFLERLREIWEPHPGQLEFLLNPSKYKVLACGRRWGKTAACAVTIVHSLLLPTKTEQLILAPTQNQAAILFEAALELLHQFTEEKPKVRATPYPKLWHGENVLTARSGHAPRSLRGQGASRVIVDEAAYVPESLVTEVALPMLATTDGELVLISTPRGRNHFWRFFLLGQRGESGFWSRQAPSSESPLVSAKFLALQRELVSERAYAVEYEAAFRDNSEQVFRTDAVEACRTDAALAVADSPVQIGVDWARYNDYTAIAVLAGDREEARLVALERFSNVSWAEAADRVAKIVASYPGSSVLCDKTGVGDPALEALQSRLPGHRVEGFVFSARSKGEIIENLSWLIDRKALRMNPHPDLLRELEHFEAVQKGEGGPRLGASNGFHDDLVIALALAAHLLRRSGAARIQLSGGRRFL
ncbi:MAG: terminase family protein [Fimbriimonadaceae bacterium]|nr:terminase family protein [Fimbriimonadaceae bacterium]QYK55468.1 MAG: terminase family protein [Fimbriimonadaceae bacterium]